MLLFAKFVRFVQKHIEMSPVFEIGHEGGTKLITFITEVNLFKGIKFWVSTIRVITK